MPGRDAERTLGLALSSAVELVESGRLARILYVDDGSSDSSPSVARELGVRVLEAGGLGPGGARNVGWRQADTPWVWFIDADCVVEPETLARLLEAMRRAAETSDSTVSGIGGSYSNAVPESLLARLIHAEIRERHLGMDGPTNFLGSFNVLYARRALEAAEGFDEGWVNGPGAPGAEDADLSYRLVADGHRLLFRSDARVAHHHPVGLWSYLRAQRLHGFWGVRLYRRHPARGRANSYSGQLDHLQPVLVAAMLAAIPIALPTGLWWLPAVLVGLLILTTLPMAARLTRRRGPEMLLFIPLAVVRALARSVGLVWGVLDWLTPGQWAPKR